jgi:hypothetical protein
MEYLQDLTNAADARCERLVMSPQRRRMVVGVAEDVFEVDVRMQDPPFNQALFN